MHFRQAAVYLGLGGGNRFDFSAYLPMPYPRCDNPVHYITADPVKSIRCLLGFHAALYQVKSLYKGLDGLFCFAGLKSRNSHAPVKQYLCIIVVKGFVCL